MNKRIIGFNFLKNSNIDKKYYLYPGIFLLIFASVSCDEIATMLVAILDFHLGVFCVVMLSYVLFYFVFYHVVTFIYYLSNLLLDVCNERTHSYYYFKILV